MDADSEKAFMQNLEEYVYDEKKVVTCKWLSCTFSLHINTVRSLVDKFLKHQGTKGNGDKLKKTYFVSGIHKDNKGLVCSILREEDLGSFVCNLSPVISQHVYSIQNGSSLQDIALLYVANQHDESCKGIIKNDAICKRPYEEISKLRLHAYPNSSAPSSSLPVNKPITKSSNNFFNSNKEIKTNKDNAEAQPSKTISTNAEAKIETENDKPKVNTVTSSTNKSIKKNTGIAGFFAKQSVVCKPKAEKVEEKLTKTSPEVKTEKLPEVEKITKTEKISPTKKTDKKESNNTVETKPNKSKATNSVKKQSNNKKDQGKKRKRIQTLDSDSEEETKEADVDDIFVSNSPEQIERPELSDDEDVIPPTPEVKVNKAPLNPRKRKKVVDKTFMDSDGYIITKKEEVYESCSENEDEQNKIENIPINNVKNEPKVEIKKNATSPVKGKKNATSPAKGRKNATSPAKGRKNATSPAKGRKKTSPQKNSKQQSLMSFFSKK